MTSEGDVTERKWLRDAAVLEADVGAERVLFHPDSGQFCNADASAGEIWALLAEPVTVAQMVADLTRRFDVEAESCTRDVEAVLDAWAERQFVRTFP